MSPKEEGPKNDRMILPLEGHPTDSHYVKFIKFMMNQQGLTLEEATDKLKEGMKDSPRRKISEEIRREHLKILNKAIEKIKSQQNRN